MKIRGGTFPIDATAGVPPVSSIRHIAGVAVAHGPAMDSAYRMPGAAGLSASPMRPP